MRKLLILSLLCASTWAQDVIVARHKASGEAACTATVGLIRDNGIIGQNGASLSYGVTVDSTDANTALVAMIDYVGSGATMTAPTWNGTQTMTQAGTPAFNATSNAYVSIWVLMNPAAGTFNIASTGTNVNDWHLNAYVFSNVNATTPIRTGTYQTNTTGSMTITSNSQDRTVSMIQPTGSLPTSNQTYNNASSGTNYSGADYGTTPASTVTHTWTASGNKAMAGASVRCK